MDNEIIKNYRIIDAHSHIFPEKIAENATVAIGKFYDLHMEGCGISERLIESGSRIGTEKYLVCSAATTPHQTESINNFIAQECAAHPEFVGFGTTHPLSDNIEADIENVRKLGLRGIKLHPDFQTFDADSPEAYRIYEQIEGVIPMLIHCGDPRYDYSSPKRIANVHRNFPKLMIFASHLGGYGRWDEAEEYLAGQENIRFDISSAMAFMSKERAVDLIRKYGVENCFFGSDFPMWSHEEELKRFLSLGFSEKENRMILAENFLKCFPDLE